MIINTLELEDIQASEIETEAPLFDGGLALDSIDALELGVAMQKRYGISLNAEAEETKQHFFSVQTLANLVRAHQDGS